MDKTKIVGISLAVCFIVSLSLVWVYTRMAPKPHPYNDILSSPRSVFWDFDVTFENRYTPYLAPGQGRGYFPLVYLLLRAMSFGVLTARQTLWGLIAVFAAAVALTPRLFARVTGGRSDAWQVILCLSSFGCIFSIDRGNIEMFIYLFVMLFFLLYMRGHAALAVVFLSLAACCKLYPAIFIILLLRDRRWREIGLFAALSAALTAGALWMSGALSWEGINGVVENLKFYVNAQIVRDWMLFNHSLFDLVKLALAKALGTDNMQYEFAKLTAISAYTGVIVGVAALLCLYILSREGKLWRSSLLLTLMMVSFPHTSYDYTLIYLLIPLMLFLFEREGEPTDGIVAVLLGVSIAPLHLYLPGYGDSLGIYLRPLVFIALFVLLVATGLNRPRAVRRGDAVRSFSHRR